MLLVLMLQGGVLLHISCCPARSSVVQILLEFNVMGIHELVSIFWVLWYVEHALACLMYLGGLGVDILMDAIKRC